MLRNNVKFDVVSPVSRFDDTYKMVVASHQDDQPSPGTQFWLQRYDFRPSNTALKTTHDSARVHYGHCADQVKVSGDIIVAICDATKSISFFKYSDLSLITTFEPKYDKLTVLTGYDDIGLGGFELI